MVLHEYKVDVKLDIYLVFIILEPIKKIIFINYYYFLITIVPISSKSISKYLLSLRHKVK